MSAKNILIFKLILILSLISCRKHIDFSESMGKATLQDMDLEVILQKRDPNLPSATTLTRRLRSEYSNENLIINTDDRLGFGYQLKKGNLIWGDVANLKGPIIDLRAVKAYNSNYVQGNRLNTTETKTVSFSSYDRYYHKSKFSEKLSTGFSLDLKVLSLGKKESMTNTFKHLTDQTNQIATGELSINFANNQFTLQCSEANRKVYARNFLTKPFIESLYNSPIASTLLNYGDFVLTGYKTGGKAYATFCATSEKKLASNESESIMDLLINASVSSEKGSGELHFGYNQADYDKFKKEKKLESCYMYMKTFGGVRKGGVSEVKPTSVDKVNVDLTLWVNSLSDESTHTMIDFSNNGLCPLSGFVLEQNFKRRMDDTFSEVLPPRTELIDPYITIVRVFVRSTPGYEPLYDIVPVLVTRQSDRIILSDRSASSISDEELRKNENPEVFLQRAKAISEEKSKVFSSMIQISYNKKTRLTPAHRNPLCIELKGFKEENFRHFFNEKTGMGYIYDPSTRICFSYFAGEEDDSVLDVYGIRDWVEALPVKKISVAALANVYKIIGL